MLCRWRGDAVSMEGRCCVDGGAMLCRFVTVRAPGSGDGTRPCVSRMGPGPHGRGDASGATPLPSLGARSLAGGSAAEKLDRDTWWAIGCISMLWAGWAVVIARCD